MRLRHWACACALASLLGSSAGAVAPGAEQAFLATAFGFSPADLAQLDRGQVVARTLDEPHKREVATLGAVRVRITPDFYVKQFDDIARFKADPAVLQIGTFQTPPVVSDVDGLTLEDADIRSLRSCRVGDCGVQLSADAIGRFRNQVDWRLPGAGDRANELMREILVEFVKGYRKGGDTRAMEYADRSERLHVGREFASLVGAELGGWEHFRALSRHLVQYPDASAAGTTDLLYWSKERVGRRGVASITHVAIARTAGRSPAEYAVASKQIYGSHYFDASLGLTVLLRDRSTAAPATYVVYVNRSRVDIFGGFLGGVARRLVSSKARETVEGQLNRLQTQLEREFAEAPGGPPS